MQQFSSTEARKNFFKILDNALLGKKILIERKGVLLELVPLKKKKIKKKHPNYKDLIRDKFDIENMDQWTWDWDPDKGLTFVDRSQPYKK